MKRTINRATAIFLSIIMVFSLFVPLTGPVYAAGDTEDYVEIYTIDDLYAVRNNLSEKYILMNDLDLTEATASGGKYDYEGTGWLPIGNKETPFVGVFNGNGHVITGMRIANPTTVYNGLFGYIGSNGIICNLGMNTGSVSYNSSSATPYAGGIAGYNSGSITECYNTGSVSYDSSSSTVISYAGGIAGYNSGSITECYNTGSVSSYSHYSSATSYAGGIAGCNSGSITECYNTGKVSYSSSSYESSSSTVISYAGGIAGYNSGSITECYNTGKVSYYSSSSISYNAGGIAGYNSGSITECYNTGSVSSSYYNAGGIVGKIVSTGSVTTSYYLDTSCSKSQPTGVTKLNSIQMGMQSSYVDWDFSDTWFINDAYEYPYPQLISNMQNSNKTIDSVLWKTVPSKINYYIGDELNLKGGYFRVYYVDGTSELISVTMDMVSGYDMNTEGTQNLTITYREKTLNYQITVSERPEIESVQELGGPDKTEFVKGTAFDFTGWRLQINYVNGTTEVMTVDPAETTGGDINNIGIYDVVFEIGGETFTQTVTVIPIEITGIEISHGPSKTTYIKGESFNSRNLKVSVTYNDGSVKEITNYTLSGFDSSTIGTKEVTVAYTVGNETFTASFEVEIVEGVATSIEITSNPDKLQYIKGQKLDLKGMVVEATYTDGTVLPITDYSYNEITEALGAQTITINYQDVSATFTVNVIDKVIEEIAIAHLPNKLSYAQEQEVDLTGLIVTAKYNDGEQKEVTDYTITGFNSKTLGNKTATIYYAGYTTEFSYKVFEAEVTSIVVTSNPVKTSYLIGEPLDLNGLEVKANYNNGKSKVITDYDVDGFTGAVGLNVVVISFEGCEYSIPIFVHDASSDWTVIKEATCTDVGKRVKYCTDCGEIAITEEIPALGHESISESVVTPTCTRDGYTLHLCGRCHETYQDSKTEATGHTPGTEANCTESQKCSVCDEIIVEALGHDIVQHDAKAPTCTEAGHKSYETCKNCDYTTFEEISATGHSPGTEANCTEPQKCTVCDEILVEATGHDIAQHNGKAPTCTEPGYRDYITCSNCGLTTFEAIPALGHSWDEDYTVDKQPTCTEAGSKSIYCVRCDAKKDVTAIAKIPHEYSEWITDKEATCIESGSEHRECAYCDSRENKVIPATGHTPGAEATCTAPQKCTVCDAILVEAKGHNVVQYEYKEATCTESGHNAYETCKNCDYTTFKIIPATGHKWGDWVISKEPTCVDGKRYRICNECSELEVGMIPALGHSMKKVAEKLPSCTVDGNKEYFVCLDCSLVFKDELGKIETDIAAEKIPALGHSWDEDYTVDKQPTCTEAGSKSIHCTECDANKDVTAIAKIPHEYGEWIIDKEETCTESGSKHRECAYCDSRENKVIPATGHTPGAEATCTAPQKCTVCNAILAEAKGHDIVQHEAKVPTCTEAGHKSYETCKNCDYTTFEEVPATGHTPGAEATCTAPQKCTVCNAILAEAKGHDIIQHKAKAPTCTEAGHKSYETCKNCDYTTFEKIAATGHTPGAEATCTAPQKCTVCNAILAEAKGHDIIQHKAKVPTCTEVGHNAYESCNNCDYTTYEEISATGHDIVQHEAKVPTCTEPGHSAYETCKNCDYTTYEEVPATGHVLGAEATCTEPQKCLVCGVTLANVIGHTYEDVVTRATLSSNGKIEQKCSECGEVESTTTIYRPTKFTLSSTAYTYDGKIKKPTVTVKNSAGKTLVKDTDYTLTYASGRKYVGEYSVKITFKDKYSGSKTLYFKINPPKTSLTSLTASSKGFMAKWSKKTTQVTGYQLQYSTSSKFTNPKTVTITKNSTTYKKITKLTAKKKYYVRVRTYKTVGTTKYYSTWSNNKYVTTKA